MGQILGTATLRHLDMKPDCTPTFDNKKGFAYKRAQRKMVAPEEHLVSAKIPKKYRDYCAHLLLEYQVCRYRNIPLLYRCHHEKHNYLNCEHDDYVMRMKEFEREKRLRVRENRIKDAAICREKSKDKMK